MRETGAKPTRQNTFKYYQVCRKEVELDLSHRGGEHVEGGLGLGGSMKVSREGELVLGRSLSTKQRQQPVQRPCGKCERGTEGTRVAALEGVIQEKWSEGGGLCMRI